MAPNNLTATATDAAGNTGASSALAVTIDTSGQRSRHCLAPRPTAGGGDHITNDNTLTLTGTAEAAARSSEARHCSAMRSGSGTGAWSYTTAALANGAHNLTATATDAAGNTGVASNALAVTITRARRARQQLTPPLRPRLPLPRSD